ncbi:MAG: aminopeptidase N [Proteobacteria bacterium]|nr:aminopeptidase N [Cystobacterineae bacterium]MCL2259437.1 aminopeptidase N [Cystobacterineae bacterium]MCL2314422.1 aminopeptidase N [Pseudomonadota bacterium]
MTAQAVYLKDYLSPAWRIPNIELRFELGLQETLVYARLHMERVEGKEAEALTLHGEGLELLELCYGEEPLGAGAFRLEKDKLHLLSPPDTFVLKMKTRICPQTNTALEGLYASNGRLLTQCEPQGFRRMMYSLDRPDVLSRFKVVLVAPAADFPVLLSNGNLVEQGHAGSQHWAVWEDPFPKPTYLFALVAGDLAQLEDVFVTHSGRRVAIRFFSEPQDVGRLSHAVNALKRALRWDEERFGLEYDLEQYTVVAVSDFNMGAMENKGLNIFNTQCVLADKTVATDADFRVVESVVAHEFFHNWTGNRVTLRDWFQLSLKEGLTIFRDQEFSAAMNSKTEQRIGDVRYLKSAQFAEDAGPLSHPVRPESYSEINNFYTATVYQKGAELVRMLETLLGKEKFDEALKLYLRRHDGKAATCEDFLAAMEEVKGEALSQFMNWYTQRGTPTVYITEHFNKEAQQLILTFEQQLPFQKEVQEKAGREEVVEVAATKPLHIPIRMALLDEHGKEWPLHLNEGHLPETHAPTERVLELKEWKQRFCFSNIPQKPVLSALRGFSAPILLKVEGEDLERLSFLAQKDSDEFNRYDATERLGIAAVQAEMQGHMPKALWRALEGIFERTLKSETLELAMRHLLVCLPSELALSALGLPINAPAIRRAREGLRKKLAQTFLPLWVKNAEAFASKEPFQLGGIHAARRSFYNTCLSYAVLGEAPQATAWTWESFERADNLTDALAALRLIEAGQWAGREEALEAFWERNKEEALVVDKWFALQATSLREDTFERVQQLTSHAAFRTNNPNRLRALLGAFAHQNPGCFHQPDGKAYVFLTDWVLFLDKKNPQMSSRLASALARWRQHVSPQREAMYAQLERLMRAPQLSPDLHEVVRRSLGN